jgi:hypothetical protein
MSSLRRVTRFVLRRVDALMGALVLILSFLVFLRAPIQQPGDSRYTMLVAENLLRHGDFALERYGLPDPDYRIENEYGHRYYAFPPGSPVLSVPYVALMHLRGLSAVRNDGTYDMAAELTLDRTLAAILMAGFATLAYFTARLLLPVSWSAGVAFVAAFGTQVFSTASRSTWSDTWGIVLVGLSALLLLRSAVQGSSPSWPLVATLEGVSYIVRPTNSLVIVGTVLYITATRRRDLWQFVLFIAAWLTAFVMYSWVHFHKYLPTYFVPDRIHSLSAQAFFGNLVSPSRGLLVNVPAVIAIVLVLVRYWRTMRFRAMTGLAIFIIFGHLFVLAGFVHWWGGHSYGARLTTSLVPWFVMLAVLGLDAASTAHTHNHRSADRVLQVAAAALCTASIGINTVGAFSWEAAKWNVIPDNIDRAPSRLWSWQRPQFLSPFVEPEGPFLPLPPEGLRLGSRDADPYLGRGWGFGEGELRWTDGHGSTIHFALPGGGPGTLELDLKPNVRPGGSSEQRITITMNGRELGSFVALIQEFATYKVDVPADVSLKENTLRLHLPDATSPGGADRRTLGIAVRVVRWRPG